MLFLSILVLGIQILFAILFFYLCLAFITGAPFVPSSKPASESMMHLAHIQKGQIIYDLGSGDGNLLFMAASRGAIAKGLEINPFLVLLTGIKSLFSPYRNQIHVYWKNFWTTDITDADIVFIYLLPWKMEILEKKLISKLKKGTIIISNSFIFPNLKCIRKDTKNHVFAFRI
jgi:predicted RNA methylase